MRRSMTYGVMPEFEEFEAAFNEAVEGGTFSIRSGLTRLALHGEWECRPLYDKVKSCADDPDTAESVLDECSSVMCILGFEWV